jgi:hypothetical protein
MGKNDLVNLGPAAPLEPWLPNKPIPHQRLNGIQAAMVTDVIVRGKGVRTVRVGGSVLVLIGEDKGAPETDFEAKITGATSIADNRWEYAWTEQRRTSSGHEDLPDGRTDADDGSAKAINGMEANNAATGIQGNGIDFDDPDTPSSVVEIQPIATGAVVRMFVGVDTDGAATFTFYAPNGIKVTCP